VPFIDAIKADTCFCHTQIKGQLIVPFIDAIKVTLVSVPPRSRASLLIIEKHRDYILVRTQSMLFERNHLKYS